MRACACVSLAVRDGASLTVWHNHHSAKLCTGQEYKDEIGGTRVKYQREYIHIYMYIYIHRERERERDRQTDRERESFGGTNRTKETTGKTET